ncbi:MAG TPA: enoyl-CoA hydratase/isomerase family protein [Tepidiformaceae bacterium]|nr:enoyl-CoA hydratase/isomerase family protein [Tepidiformaceae bacterium]
MADGQAVRYDRDGALAILTLANPPLNLYGGATSQGLLDGIERAEAEGARAVLYRAEGKYFSAGVDVSSFGTPASPVGGGARRTGLLSHRFETSPLPVVCAVHALCLTAAFEAALGCDLIIAAESAKFGLIESTIGLTPLAGGTQRIAQRAGISRAAQVAMSGERYDAATMERWGVINHVFPDEGFEQRAIEFAQQIAAGPTLAFGVTKQVIQTFVDGGLDEADAKLPSLTAPLRETEDHKQAIKTFFEKGPGHATFNGR